MSGNYGPSGALFTNERKQAPNHPDYEGYLELDAELVRLLVEQVKSGETPKLDVKGWKKQSKKDGRTFLSLSPKPPFKRNSGGSGGGNRRGGDPFGEDFGSPGSRGGSSDPWG